MHVTVFGANGKIGRLVVAQLLHRGHAVTAFVHGFNTYKDSSQLNIVRGDIYNEADVRTALQGSEAVISTLGSWGTLHKNVLSVGMKHIIPSMKDLGIGRIVTLTGADSRAEGDRLSLLHRVSHTGIAIIAKKVLQDSEDHIRQLQASNVSWTVVRSPIMNNKGSKNYSLSTKRPAPWVTIRRVAVATAIVDQLKDQLHVQQCLYIVRTK